MPNDDEFQEMLQHALDDRRARSLHRRRRVVELSASPIARVDGRALVNFSSNDYLGLRSHPAVVAAAAHATKAHGMGSGASPLVTGYARLHELAERAIATWKDTANSILLPSGYQASHAAIQAIAGAAEAEGRRVRILVDKLVHASLVDAARCSGLTMRVFPHNGVAKLARLLEEAEEGELQVVLTESIFSMDGDAANLRALVDLKRRRPFTLLVDEAHGSGVYGKDGGGLAAELGLSNEIDAFVVTLSKALGGAGGAICSSAAFCDAVVNFGRAYIYSTNVPPVVPAAAIAALDVLRAEPERQARVREMARFMRAALLERGFDIPMGNSRIIPVILGSEEAAIAEADRLRDEGFLVMPIRPPTVPRGTSRLRVTLSAAHTDTQIESLLDALTKTKQSS